jgi:hypothetical protein
MDKKTILLVIGGLVVGYMLAPTIKKLPLVKMLPQIGGAA